MGCGLNIFFTADTHFGHKNILKYASRPFKCIRDMDERLIENWNMIVPMDGMVYHLGDFAFKGSPKYHRDIVSRLNGKICLVRGSHDKLAITQLGNRFEWIEKYYELVFDDVDAPMNQRFIVLCHTAFRVWERSHYGSWNLYGHSHGRLSDIPGALAFDVGVDSAAKYFGHGDPMPENYRPFTYQEIKDVMAGKVNGAGRICTAVTDDKH